MTSQRWLAQGTQTTIPVSNYSILLTQPLRLYMQKPAQPNMLECTHDPTVHHRVLLSTSTVNILVGDNSTPNILLGDDDTIAICDFSGSGFGSLQSNVRPETRYERLKEGGKTLDVSMSPETTQFEARCTRLLLAQDRLTSNQTSRSGSSTARRYSHLLTCCSDRSSSNAGAEDLRTRRRC